MTPSSRLLVLSALATALLGSASCEKEETPVTLPQPTGAAPGVVVMGEDYQTQIFWDFETNKQVYTSPVTSWDLCFESAVSGYHVWMNGGKGVNTLNTHATDFSQVRSVPTGVQEVNWGYDDPGGQVTQTAIGDWCDPQTRKSKNEVFIARLPSNSYFKFQITAVSDSGYTLLAGPLEGEAQAVTLRKDSTYSRVYFSFTSASQPQPDPPRRAWDVVFTRYRHVYYGQNGAPDTPYVINGVLLNPFNTTAAQEPGVNFASATLETATPLTFSNDRDVIGGLSWKRYNFNTARYEVLQQRTYFIRNRNRALYKLHFLDFYKDGVKGSPSFESQRLQ